jgi:hypothetical protein
MKFFQIFRYAVNNSKVMSLVLADRIDMPTFGKIWTRLKVCALLSFIMSYIISYLSFETNLLISQRGFVHHQVMNCYLAFSEQSEVLLDAHEIWEPYSLVTI